MGFAGNPEEAGPNRKYSLDALPQEFREVVSVISVMI